MSFFHTETAVDGGLTFSFPKATLLEKRIWLPGRVMEGPLIDHFSTVVFCKVATETPLHFKNSDLLLFYYTWQYFWLM